MKNSTILFLAAVLVLVWFGSEAFTAQEICVTTCIQFQGAAIWEEAIAVAILPAILLAGAFKLRSNENIAAAQRKSGGASATATD